MSWRIYQWQGPPQALTLAPPEVRDAPGTDLPPVAVTGWCERQLYAGGVPAAQVEEFLRHQGVFADPQVHGGCVMDNLRAGVPMQFTRPRGDECVVVGVVPVL